MRGKKQYTTDVNKYFNTFQVIRIADFVLTI